jgi:predicted SAM-dependent methyltransferase
MTFRQTVKLDVDNEDERNFECMKYISQNFQNITSTFDYRNNFQFNTKQIKIFS